MELRVQCYGSCEKFYPRGALSRGYCRECSINWLAGRTARAVTFLRGKPYVLRSQWTQWAFNTLKLSAREMDDIILGLQSNGVIESRVRKGARGAPATLYRLRDARLRQDAFTAPLDTNNGGADNGAIGGSEQCS